MALRASAFGTPWKIDVFTGGSLLFYSEIFHAKMLGNACPHGLVMFLKTHGVVMFREDNLVVYPTQGVGKIERIDHKDIGGVTCEFYIVRVRSNNITLMVPVRNADAVGLRALVSKNRAQTILEILRGDLEKEVFTGQNWNRRFREYSERLKSSDLGVVAEVLRELLLIGRNKELSFGERRLLEQAMNLVSGELAEVLGMSAQDLRDELLTLYAPVPLQGEDRKSA